MTTYTHNPNNHLSRRASISATAPYTIPQKGKDHSNGIHGSPFSPPSNVHIPHHQHRPSEHGHTTNGHQHHQHQHQHRVGHNSQHQPQQQQQQQQQQQLSSSVPVLSREFVVRRISEGETGRLKEELKCEACGKGYKHISSLAKHLWEHTPEWNVTKKLLISKHQQVQLLEAASILVSMNEGAEDEQEPKTQQTNGLVFKNGEVDHTNVKFNSKYHDSHSPQPILEEDEIDEDDYEDDDAKINIKLRTGSISQYPPSFTNNQHSGLNSQRFPDKLSQSFQSPNSISKRTINGGGFLDMPLKGAGNGHMNSISGVINRDENKEEERSVRTNEEEDDGTVFGQMD